MNDNRREVLAATVADFQSEVDKFLAAYPERPAAEDFEWGVGSDEVAFFEELDPQAERHEMDAVREWRRVLHDAGLAWITGPREFGGRDLSDVHQAAFDSAARRRQVPNSAPLTVSLGMVAPTIMAHGTHEAKAAYLERLYSGELVACQLFSEPGAGSDLASVSARAHSDGDGWRVTGQKVWTSGAHLADIGLLLCRTSDGPSHQNLTAFVIDMHQPGVEVRPLRQMTGGSAFNEVFLQDAWIPDVDRLGNVDGGWTVAMTTLTNERGALGSGGLGGRGLLDIDRLKALVVQSGREDDARTRQLFAELVMNLKAASWTRRRLQSSPGAGASMSMIKLALCRDFAQIGRLVAECLGPKLIADADEWGTYAWSRFVLGFPGYRIGGGTDEVLKNVIAERVLGLPRDPGGR